MIEFTVRERIHVMHGLRLQLDELRHTMNTNVEDSWQWRTAARERECVESALAKFDVELDEAAASLIGKHVAFSFEPYHSGRGTIENLERRNSPHVDNDTYWEITIRVIKGTTVSRLMGQSSHKPMDQEFIDGPLSEHSMLDMARSDCKLQYRHVYSV